VVTGDTLCDEKNPVILERMDFPDPVIKIAIEPKSKADLEKMGMGLNVRRGPGGACCRRCCCCCDSLPVL
jgi:hypothetical protein